MSWKLVNMPLGNSLRKRLVIQYAVMFVVSSMLVAAVFYIQVHYAVRAMAREYIEAELRTTIYALESTALEQNDYPRFLSKNLSMHKGGYPLSYALYNKEHNVLIKSDNFIGEVVFANVDRETIHTYAVHGPDEKRVLIATSMFTGANGEIFFLQLGLHDSDAMRHVFSSMKTTAFVLIPFVCLVAVLGALIITRHAFLPLKTFVHEVKDLRHNMRRRLATKRGADEIDDLAGAFNETYDHLQEAYDRIVQFTADASHELRIPLTAIKGEAQVVLERERSLEEHRSVLVSIVEEIDRLGGMINRLLQLARADSGVDIVQKEPVAIDSLLMQLIDFFEPLCNEKDILVQRTLNDPAVTMMADRTRIEELFANIIENAIKYTPHNGTITVVCEEKDDAVIVSVCDTGIGIPRNELSLIFKRFYRVDKSRARSEGSSGLGLSIAESIASAHGGRIDVESEPGKGSCFRIILPTVRA